VSKTSGEYEPQPTREQLRMKQESLIQYGLIRFSIGLGFSPISHSRALLSGIPRVHVGDACLHRNDIVNMGKLRE
jgi:hypothetical protein